MLVLFMFTACASAQDRINEGATVITDNMKAQLALNDSQYKKIHAINLDFLNQGVAIKKSGGGKADKATKIKLLDEARDAKVKPVLTAKQYETYLVMKKENRKKLKAYIKDKKAAND